MTSARHVLASLAVSATLVSGALSEARSRPVQSSARALPAPEREVFQQDVSWSRDGRRIAFSEYSGGREYKPDRWAVCIVDADGDGRRVVLENAMYASWAPDGKRLAVGAERRGNWDVYAVDVDGGGLRRLTENPARDYLPAWSPDGRGIAFSSDRDGNLEIYVMNSDGSHVTRVTHDPASDCNPAWSPDGARLVFYREKGDGKDQVYVVGADGSGERAVTDDDANNIFPSFLPDGKIGFASTRPDTKKTEVVLVAPDGAGRSRLGDVEAFFARWSPDGRRVAFVAGGWPRSAVYVVSSDGTGARKIVN